MNTIQRHDLADPAAADVLLELDPECNGHGVPTKASRSGCYPST
jgi:hypothetical protein